MEGMRVSRPLHLGVHVLDLQCEAEELNLMYSTRILKLSAEEASLDLVYLLLVHFVTHS
jgi:hypothetical protein